MKKTARDIIILHNVPKTMIICYTVPEMWRVMNVIVIFHFGLFSALYPPPPPNIPKNQHFKKIKTLPHNIIILHKCTKNHDHMLYCSWYLVHDRLIVIFHFGLFFALRDQIKRFGIANYKSFFVCSKSKTRLLQLFHKSQITNMFQNWYFCKSRKFFYLLCDRNIFTTAKNLHSTFFVHHTL